MFQIIAQADPKKKLTTASFSTAEKKAFEDARLSVRRCMYPPEEPFRWPSNIEVDPLIKRIPPMDAGPADTEVGVVSLFALAFEEISQVKPALRETTSTHALFMEAVLGAKTYNSKTAAATYQKSAERLAIALGHRRKDAAALMRRWFNGRCKNSRRLRSIRIVTPNVLSFINDVQFEGTTMFKAAREFPKTCKFKGRSCHRQRRNASASSR